MNKKEEKTYNLILTIGLISQIVFLFVAMSYSKELPIEGRISIVGWVLSLIVCVYAAEKMRK